MQYKNSRQTCVGLIVNEKINVKKEYYRKVRAMCDNYFKNNTFYINDEEEENSGAQLEGMLNFVYKVKHYKNGKKLQNVDNKHDSIKELYKKFLLLKYFSNIEKPIILTEGKSDIVYLKCALKNMKNNYPELVEIIDKKYSFNIKFFKSSKLFREVFSIAEGTSGLEKLMHYYKREVEKFHIRNKHTPIIIIIDNDEGAKNIRNLVKLGKEDNYFKLFHEQMYVLIIDTNENKKIEDLFDNQLLNTEIDGKRFKADKTDNENDKYFGKHIFSQKLILPNYEKINFDKFKPIFDNILEIMTRCKQNEKIDLI